MVKISGLNRSVKITDHFTCISTKVVCCITCTLSKKTYIGETGRRLADRFREHLRDAERKGTDASKPVAHHFNLPNHSHHNMIICGLSLDHEKTESRKNLEQKFIFQLGTLYPHGINERLSSPNLLTNSCYHIFTNGKAPPHLPKTNNTHNSSIRSDQGLTLETSAFQIVHGGNSTFINTFDKTKFSFPPYY